MLNQENVMTFDSTKLDELLGVLFQAHPWHGKFTVSRPAASASFANCWIN